MTVFGLGSRGSDCSVVCSAEIFQDGEACAPVPIRDFINAAVQVDLETMFRQVDWQAGRAAPWARNIDSPYLPTEHVDKIIAAGFREFKDVNPGMVNNKLFEIALHVSSGVRLRRATDEESASVLDVLRAPKVKRTLPRNIVVRLDEWSRRASAVAEVWAMVTQRHTYWLALAGNGKKVLLVNLEEAPSEK